MSKREFWLKIAQLLLGTTLLGLGSRIAVTGVAALTSIFQALIAGVASAFDYRLVLPDAPVWVGVTLLIVGVGVAVLGAYWQRPAASPAPVPNPNDIDLLRRFRAEFTEGRKDFLRDHNFWGSFPSAALDFVTEVANWRGARFEFVDSETNSRFSILKSRAQHLDELSAAKTWPHHVAPYRQTAVPEHHDEYHPHPHIVQAVDALNQAARALVDAADEFEHVAKVRVPIG